MRKLIVLSILLLAVGCVGIAPESIDTSVNNITVRYEAYVAADSALSADQKEAYTLESKLLRELVEEAKK